MKAKEGFVKSYICIFPKVLAEHPLISVEQAFRLFVSA